MKTFKMTVKQLATSMSLEYTNTAVAGLLNFLSLKGLAKVVGQDKSGGKKPAQIWEIPETVTLKLKVS